MALALALALVPCQAMHCRVHDEELALNYNPLVTIITPTLDQGRFISATLASVAAQDYPSIEHIVIDGGSTDGTTEILRSWTSHEISWLSEPDIGQADAINKGVRLATGDICTWLNSDDVYLARTAISEVVECIRRSGSRAVTGGGRYIDEAGRLLDSIPVYREYLDADALRHVDRVLQPATFYSTDLARELPLDTRLRWTFDWDFFIRLADSVHGITPLDAQIAGYRRHGDSKTWSGGPARQREILRLLHRYHGWSFHYWFFATVIAGRVAADRLPPSWRDRFLRQWHALAERVDYRITGRGIPY